LELQQFKSNAGLSSHTVRASINSPLKWEDRAGREEFCEAQGGFFKENAVPYYLTLGLTIACLCGVLEGLQMSNPVACDGRLMALSRDDRGFFFPSSLPRWMSSSPVALC
jgi:hypothetical protein